MRLKILLLISFIVFSGCASSKGVYHTVGRGETLWRICHTYGADVNEVAEANHIKDPTEIEAGRRIFIPGARKRLKTASYIPPAAAEKGRSKNIPRSRNKFIWPVKGELASRFGSRNGIRYDGIDIKTADGAQIKAADDGHVVYVSEGLKSHGNTIIIKHKDGFYTVYSHNKENLVSDGKNVTKGDVIGTVAGDVPLHFEVRHGRSVLDPLFYLP